MRGRQSTVGLAMVALGLVLQTMPAAAGPTAASEGPTLSVDGHGGEHAISPDIYGMNFPDEALAEELQLPVDRWGGNSTSRYNWHSKTTNRANDYFFENTPMGGGIPGEMDLDATLLRDKRIGAKSIVTMPLLGYVVDPAKTGACGFSVKKYGKQSDSDKDCGNGQVGDKNKVSGNNPLDTSIKIGPDYVTDEVRHLVSTYGRAGAGGVAFYSLDNEPGIWENTHQDVHPAALTYDELAQRGITYAKAIKAGDPKAKVFGPVDWGFIAYLDSEADISANDTHDKDAHGGEDLAAWYLDQMRAYETSHGQRLLDYLDEHYYPADDALALSSAGDANKQQERLDATRALWDPTYLDQSYIGNDMHQKVMLIPRLKQYVTDHYPGTKIALTEYNFGGLESVNGTLAEADALGIFGREGLDLATMWSAPSQSDPGANAFRAYLNYDGAGSRFGETSVSATSADQNKLSIYAARRTADGALTMVVINKSHDDLHAPIAIRNGPVAKTADVWRYGGGEIQRIVPDSSVAVVAGHVDAAFPAQSITVVVVPGTGRAPSAAAVVSPVATTSTTTKSVNLALIVIAALILVAAIGATAVPDWRRRVGITVLVTAYAAAAATGGAAAVFRTERTMPRAVAALGAGTGTPTTQSEQNPISITSLNDGDKFKAGGKVSGTVKLAADQRLFTEIFSAGSDKYYDVSADDPVKVQPDGSFTVVENIQGDKSDTFTLVAFVLPDKAAQAFIASDKGNASYQLPPGSVAQLRITFKLEA